jgi:PleD family two-component response regulator
VAEDRSSQILIVEDDVDLAEMLNAYFRVQGYEILTATWGEDGVRVAQEIVPDVILLDIRLPDIDGYEVCRRIRATRRTREIPIIFLTERRERSDRLAGLELGAVDYITKPFDIQELRLRVRNTLRRSAQSPMTNPITGLSERAAVDERLKGLLNQDGWALLVVSLGGLDEFREQYGFVAADDVLRAVSLMLSNTVQETGDKEDLVGHLDPTSFVIMTQPSQARNLQTAIMRRLQPSIQYFYPLRDRERVVKSRPPGGALQFSSGVIQAKERAYDSVDGLKTALLRSRRPT